VAQTTGEERNGYKCFSPRRATLYWGPALKGYFLQRRQPVPHTPFLEEGQGIFSWAVFCTKKPDRSANWFSPGNYRFLVQAFSYPPLAVKPGDEKTTFTETTR